MGKNFTAILLIILALSGVALLQSTAAVPSPSKPQITAQYVDYSYYTPTLYTTDPYTGQQVQTRDSHNYIENRTILVTITNQPWSYSADGYHIYYTVEIKGHFEDNWKQYYGIYGGVSDGDGGRSNFTSGILQTTTQYTKIAVAINEDDGIPAEGTLDVRVFAVTSHLAARYTNEHPLLIPPIYYYYGDAPAVDSISDYSNVETVTIGDSAPTEPTTAATNQLTPSPENPNTPQTTSPLDWQTIALIILACVVAVMGAAIVMLWRRTAST